MRVLIQGQMADDDSLGLIEFSMTHENNVRILVPDGWDERKIVVPIEEFRAMLRGLGLDKMEGSE